MAIFLFKNKNTISNFTPEYLPEKKIKTLSRKDACTPMFTAALFMIAKVWSNLNVHHQKNIYFCFIDYAKAFDCVDHNKHWKILKEMGIPDHLTCLLRNSHADQEATVRTGHGTTDWFQIGKGIHQGCILSPCFY